MSYQEKITGILRLILMLSGSRKYSMSEIKDRLQVSDRTVYRYIKVIEGAGFFVERGEGYRLKSEGSTVKDLNALFHFTEDEIYAIHHLLENSDSKTFTGEKLIKKLHAFYDLEVLKLKNRKSELVFIDVLKAAIQKKKQVILCAYRSSNSQKIRDRKVEAFAFLPDYRGVWCFDTEDKKIKQFYLSRIKEMKLLDTGWFYREQHLIPFTDAFRMSSGKAIAEVKLKMTLKGYNLLKDEHPVALKFVKQNGTGYDLEIPVAAYEGVGRFVMGLVGEVRVSAPQEFKAYLKEKSKIFSSLTEFDS